MKSLPLILASGALLAASTLPARAAQGDHPGFYAAIGYSSVQPKNNNGTLAGAFRTSIGNDSEPTLTLGYRFTGNWSAEAWMPVSKFKHTVRLDGMTSASIKHMPYLLTAQYHFMPGTRFQPFVGIGYGWVNVNGERTEGPLAGTSLNVKQGDGVTAQVGADLFASDNVFVRADVRYFDWKSRVSLNGAGIGQVKVDPFIYSLSVGYQF